MGKVRVKPSKSQSFIGMVAGGIFVIIGIGIIPMAGIFGIIWTLMALAIASMHAYNYFSNRGMASWEIDVDENKETNNTNNDFEVKLRKLNRLKEDRLISESEFERKRAEIMKSEW